MKDDLETWLADVSHRNNLSFQESGLIDNKRKVRKTLNKSQKSRFNRYLDQLVSNSSEFREVVSYILSLFDNPIQVE
ncbi:MAG: hypothetical protein ACXAD7_11450 [Candidatus Kariarchaeaceae archaeon]